MSVVEHLGWVLLHSVWQFAVMALVAGVAAAMLRTRSAAARYAVLVGAMALMAVAPVVTWWCLPTSVETDSVVAANTPAAAPIETEIERTPDNITVVAEPSPAAPTVTPVAMTPPAKADIPIAAPAPVVEQRTWSETLAETLRPWMTVLVAAWSLGVVLCSLRPLLGWWTLHRLQTLGVSAVSDDLTAMFQRVSDRIGLRKAVRVLQSTLCQTPMVLGYFRPVVLLPVSLLTRIPPAQLEAILAHELAHIRRHDFVINLLQTLIETLCFYHPAVWWVSHRIRIEREHCCDDLVIAAFNNRTDYGRALLAVEELRGVRPHLALGAADGSLLSRIRRIVGLRTDVAGYSVWTGFALLMGFVTAAAGVSVFANLLVNAPTKPQTTLIVESPIVVEHIFLQRLREMKSTRREQTADSAEILRFSSDEFHAVFRDVKDAIAPRLSGHGTCRVLPPSPPAFAPTGIANTSGGSETWKNSPTSRTHINWSTGGFYFCASSAEEVELRLKKTYGFDVQQDTGANAGMQMVRGQTQLNWKGRVPSGEIVAVVTSPQNSDESFVHLLSLYEAVAVPTENLKLFEAIQSQAPRDKWIEAGPTLALQQTERAAHWHSASKKSIRELDEPWHRRLPGGGHVQLIAVGRPKIAPSIWWTPTGEPITGLPHNITPNLRGMEYAAVLRIWEEDQSRSSMAPNSVSMNNTITNLPDEFRIAGSQLVIVPVEAPQAGGHPHLAIGAGIGAWTSETNIPATVKAEAELNQVTFKLAAFHKFQQTTAGVFYWKPVREWDWTVTAVTKDGQRIPCSDNPLVYANDPQDTKQIGSSFYHPVTQGQIDHYVIRSRPCQWIDFVDFALQPTVALVPPQEFSGTDNPPPGDAAPPIATWNNQRSLEFVGITKNTAAVKEGWQPNGTPIGDVPNWKSTVVLHGGNSMSTYIEGQRKHQPDDHAIDFLFRFRGLNDQPSLTFETPTTGTSYSHLPVQNPYEIRVSSWKRDPKTLTPGASFSNPDGVVKVGLTDEPWGRWVKISPDGDIPEPIQPHELYASTYRLFDVRGAEPFDRIPTTGTAILIHEPNGQVDPQDEWHRYTMEFRAVDADGKTHWANRWESRGLDDRQWTRSKYGLMQPLPEGKTLAHYEYRLRPYRHWAIFENVSLEPGTATTVKVSTRTWPSPLVRLDQWNLLNADGSAATFNTVVSAQVGYPLKPQRPWIGWRDKSGLVSMETLPIGSHWVLAAPEFEQRTLFPMTQPGGQSILEQRLRRSEPWTKHDLEFTPRFEPDEKTGGAIVVTIKNKFDKPLTVSEADFSLEAGTTHMVRGMSPQWADGKFQTIEIPAGKLGEVRLNWNEWVRRGFWASRDGESISEPTLPPDEPGRIYVRVNLGNHGALPIAVTAPAMLLAHESPKPDAQANVEQPIQFHGSVRDAQQRPVTRATVALSVVSGGDYERREKTVATTVVDESGAFTLPVASSLLQRNNPRAALHLWAWGPDVAQQGMTVVRIESPSDEPYPLTLLPPTTERVRLVDERGQSVRAVIEQLSLSMGFDLVLPDDLAKKVLSQREINGDFELVGFPGDEADHHSVWLRSPERGRLHCQWRPKPKTAVTTLIWRDPVTIRGQLKAANGELPAEVIQQAEITLTTHGEDSPERVSWNVGHAKVRCDREGRFEAHTLTPGSLQTEVNLPGITGWKRLKPKDAAGNSLVINTEKELEADIVLARTRKLQGQFIDGEKNPLPGIELSIMHGQLQRTVGTNGDTTTSAGHNELVRTDSEGMFSLDIVPGLVSIGKQSAPGSRLGTAIHWPTTETFMQPDGLLQIEPGDAPFVLPPVILATLAGRVIDQDERPYKGLVLASRGSPSEVTGMAATDEDGLFRLETMWDPERFKVLPHDAFDTLPPKEPNTDTILVTREPLVLQVRPKQKTDPATSDASDTQSRGTLLGRFIYDGEPPVPRDRAGDLVKLTADSPLPRDPNGRVSGVAALFHSYLKQGIRPETKDPSLLVDKTGGIANIIIWVSSPNIPYAPKEADQTSRRITVLNGQFQPRVTKLLTGQTLEVTNQDPVPFNFHAHWIRNPDSNILIAPLTKDNTIRLVVKEEEKLPVKYQSDIAPWADGFIVVRDNPYVAISQADGTFTMPDLPPGEWEFRVWHERNGYVTHWPKGLFTKKIEPGENSLGNIRLKPEQFAERK